MRDPLTRDGADAYSPAAALRLIFLNRFFFPDHSATSQMVSDLAFELAARGHDVTVIASALTYDGERIQSRRETIRGVEVIRLPATRFGRAHLFGRAVDYLVFYVACLFSLLLRVKAGGIVVAKTDPPMLSMIAVPVCAIKGALAVNWLQDLFPEVATALGLGRGRKRQWALKGLLIIRNYSLKRASLNVAIGDRMADKLQKLGVAEERIAAIPNWASGALIRPVPRLQSRLRQEWGVGDAFVVGYSGNLGRAHEIETMLAALAELERAPQQAATSACLGDLPQSPIRWLFIGGGSGMERLKREAESRNLQNLVFRPYQPRELLAESLSIPDVHLISLRSELEGLVLPSKFYGIAAAGRPAIFVGHPEGEIAEILRRSGAGIAVCEGDGRALARAILTLAEDPELASRLGQRARELFEENYDFPIGAKAWEAALAACNGRRGRQRTLAGR